MTEVEMGCGWWCVCVVVLRWGKEEGQGCVQSMCMQGVKGTV